MTFPRRTVALVGSVAMLTAVAAPSVGMAKTTKKFVQVCQGDKTKNKDTPKGTVLVGKCSSTSISKGPAKFTGLMLLPKLTTTVKLKGGTVTYTWVTKSNNLGVSNVSFKFTKCTGKYKGCKGGGKIKSNVQGYSKAVGKITY